MNNTTRNAQLAGYKWNTVTSPNKSGYKWGYKW